MLLNVIYALFVINVTLVSVCFALAAIFELGTLLGNLWKKKNHY